METREMHPSLIPIREGRFDALRATLFGVLLLAAPGCARPGSCPAQAPEPIGAERVPKSARRLAPAHAPLQRLATSVEALECTRSGLDLGAASDAFSSLADALELPRGSGDLAAQEVRNDAHVLAADSEAAKAPQEAIRDALTIALQTLLAKAEPARRQLEYRNTVGSLARSVAGVSGVASDRESCRFVVDALRAAANAVFLALAGEPPFDEQQLGSPGLQPLVSMSEGIEPARAAVLALGEAHWEDAPEAAAQALRTFAAMVRAGDCTGRFTSQLSELRFEAERLTRSDALSFGQVRWIKAGLVDALDGLDVDARRAPVEHSGTSSNHVGSALIDSARKAAANIDGTDLLGFQRTAVQDAFRATLDAFVVVAQPMPECQK
ncbi:MAG TPA: hypothetical protein VHW01_15930 [Polyangiaceae bacterium]|jgi:hypothetical protein|nr:hypothetical protein [Polyangiaceae bacterium]